MEDDGKMDDSVANERQELGEGNSGDASTSLGKTRGRLLSQLSSSKCYMGSIVFWLFPSYCNSPLILMQIIQKGLSTRSWSK